MVYGRDATLPQDLALEVSKQGKRGETSEPGLNYQLKLHNTLKRAYEELREHKSEDQAKYKAYYDRQHREVEFKINDKVLVLFDTPTKGHLFNYWRGNMMIK